MKQVLVVMDHLLITFSFMLISFFGIDHFNPSMAFVDHRMTKTLILIFSLCLITLCAYLGNRFRKACCLVLVLPVVLSLVLTIFFGIDLFLPAKLYFSELWLKIMLCTDASMAFLLSIACAFLFHHDRWELYKKHIGEQDD